MQKFWVVGIVLALGLYTFRERRSQPSEDQIQTVAAPAPESLRFDCDGRNRCPQMTSCDEAIKFLKNCPGMEMDGDNDGIPCESQWCGSR
jgi:hypothetical protein